VVGEKHIVLQVGSTRSFPPQLKIKRRIISEFMIISEASHFFQRAFVRSAARRHPADGLQAPGFLELQIDWDRDVEQAIGARGFLVDVQEPEGHAGRTPAEIHGDV
jgi:hypothetical protein